MRYIVAITGASGATYARKFLGELAARGADVSLSISSAGFTVLADELGAALDPGGPDLAALLPGADTGRITYYPNDRIDAPPASGSFGHEGMIIVPCSAGTLSRIGTGSSRTLIERAADCCLKEGRSCIAVLRETPLTSIHIRNMLAFAEAGGTVLPASPVFYTKPESVDDMVRFVVGKILDRLGLEHDLYPPYEGPK